MWDNITDISPFAFEYLRKEAFWLFLLIPAIVIWYLYKESSVFKQINIPTLSNFEEKKFNFIAFFRHINLFVFVVGLLFIILALAKPHKPEDISEFEKKNIEGIDIVLSVDVSTSMLAEDIKPNRLEAAKDVASDFIAERPTDRIGLVVYEGDAFTQAPLTTDHELLNSLLEKIQPGMVTPGTAIGLGIITAVNRLRESDAKSKVIILMTDGLNNSGDMMPIDAAQIAKELGITIYAIGLGKEGGDQSNIFSALMQGGGEQIDEELLTDIANMTGGNYYRAQSKTELKHIYEEIDQLEKSKVKVLDFKISPPEKYYGFLVLGLLLILSYKVIQSTLLKSIP